MKYPIGIPDTITVGELTELDQIRLCEVYDRHMARAKQEGNVCALRDLLMFRDAVLCGDFPTALALVKAVADAMRVQPRDDGVEPTIPAEVAEIHGEPEAAGKPLSHFMTALEKLAYFKKASVNKSKHNRKVAQRRPTNDDIRKAFNETSGDSKKERITAVVELLGVSRSTINRAIPTTGRRGRPKKK